MSRSAERIRRFVRAMSLHLRRIEHTPALSIERVATVERCAIVPDDDVTERPTVLVTKLGLRTVRPQLVQQRLRLFYAAAVHVGGVPPSEEYRVTAGFRMRGNDRVARARRRSDVIVERSARPQFHRSVD